MCKVWIEVRTEIPRRANKAHMTIELDDTPPEQFASILAFMPYIEPMLAAQEYDPSIVIELTAELDGVPVEGKLPLIVLDNLAASLRARCKPAVVN